MALLSEYALTPDVFDVSSYDSEEVCGLHLQNLKHVLTQEGLVRDLCQGNWGRLFLGDDRAWHQRGKELLEALMKQRRLVTFPRANVSVPVTEAEWCAEALATHQVSPLSGVIVTDGLVSPHRSNGAVASVNRLASTPWWAQCSCSLRLPRTLLAYRNALDLILRHANSLMIIDPYFDPSDRTYSDFLSLLDVVHGRTPAPLVEIHRAVWYESGQDKRPKIQEIEAALTPNLSACAQRTGLIFNVFLWNDIHDRYLISDLVGISLPYGFSTTKAPNAFTTWSRIRRVDCDAVQREFDVAARKPKHQFTVR